ncbi:AraC family transcriptional regulator [Dyella tabacisoli]|uniref:AraC family transcriptional regulator n=1 Tax=Dyella tabacisoli TaxID=2282381 RepID=A0A369UNX7_9GAMM|nr:AraC family transcriptional regulator [Dyella tabacisoli]RDD80029.1 AraC family transcriptional regulator [Dyella tabacisoli]
MNNAFAYQRYHARLQRVITYIDVHLSEDLSVETLAAVAAFSPFHFQRQFTPMFGIGVPRFIVMPAVPTSVIF